MNRLLAALFAVSAICSYAWLFLYSGLKRVPVYDIRPVLATYAFYLSVVASICFTVLAVVSFRASRTKR